MAIPASKKLTTAWAATAALMAISGVAQLAIAGQYQYTAVCGGGHGSLSAWTSREQAVALGKIHDAQHAGHHSEVRWR